MSENGTQHRTGVLSQLFSVIDDHWELLSLEMGYETQQAARRLIALAIAFVFCFLAMIVAQVAVIYGLIAVGLSAAIACVIVASVYMLLGIGIYWKWGRRDPRVGPPFVGTRREVTRSLQWMQKLFS